MYKRTIRWMATVALAVGTLSACSDAPGPTDVCTPFGETISAGVIDASYYDALSSTDDAIEGGTLYTQATGATLVSTESFESGTVTIAIVGPDGGTMVAGNHTLDIPRNAVSEATEFTMSVQSGHQIVVDLSARSVVSGDSVTQFPVPLALSLSYKGLIRNSDAKRLRNVYLVEDSPSLLLPLFTTVDKRNKILSSPIWHFSLYGMAME